MEPDFEEGDIFRLIVPMRSAGAIVTSGKRNSKAKNVTKFLFFRKKLLRLMKARSFINAVKG